MQLDFKNESKVLVLYTGGTIGMRMLTIWRKIKSFFQSGMVRNSEGVLVPQPNAMESRIREIVTMHDEDYSRVGKRHLIVHFDKSAHNLKLFMQKTKSPEMSVAPWNG